MALTVGELVAYLRADDKDWHGPLRRARRTLNDMANDTSRLGSRMDAAAGSALRAGASVAKVGSAVSAVSAVSNAVTGLSGVLGLIPGAAAAAAAAIATIKIGTSGLGKAITGLGASGGGGGGGGGGAADKAVGDARRIADAERGVQRAQEQAQYAQESLTRAREDAAREIADLQDALKGQALDEEAATLAVARARERLAKIQTTEGASALDMKEAELGVRQAEAALQDTKKQYAQLGQEAAMASAKGVEGSDQVVAAQRGVRDAARGVEDAQRSLAEAHEDAARGAAASAGAAGAANEAFNKLSPNAKAVALAIHGMAGEWLKVTQSVQDALFAGVASDLKELGSKYLPVAKVGFTGIATEINRGARETAAYLAQSRQVKDVAGIFANVRKTIGDTASTAKPLTSIFLDITAVSSEMLAGLTGGFGSAAQHAADFVRHARETGQLKDWIQGGIDALSKLFKLLGNIGSIIGTIWKAFDTGGAGALDTMIELTKKVKDFLKSAEGQAGLKALAGIVHTFAEVGGKLLIVVLQSIAKLLVDIGPSVAELARQFGQVLTGALQTLLPIAAAVIKWIIDNIDWLGPLALAFYGVVKAIGFVNEAMKLMKIIASTNPWLIFIGVMIALVTLIITKWDEIKTAIGQVWQWISDRAAEVWGWVKRVIIDNIVGAAQWVGNKVGEIIQFFRDLPGNIVKAIGNLGRTLYEKGQELVQGMIDGIKSMAHALSDAVLGTERSAVKSTKKELGIGSPSKVFREIGMYTGMGFVGGIGSMTEKIAAAAAGMTDAAMVDIPAPRVDPMPLGGGGAGGIGDPAAGFSRRGERPMVILQPDGTAASAALLEAFREAVRDQGGDVQVVIGT